MLSWDEFDKEDDVELSATKAAPSVVEMSLDKLHATGFESHDWQTDLEKYIQKEL